MVDTGERDLADPVRVLHVDDQPEFGELTAEYLPRVDDRFEVAVVDGPSAALERLAAGDIDCVVSDYEMPRQNGLELLRAVRDAYPDLPFVLFTGKGSEEVASEAISAGVTDYLRKSHNPEQFDLLANRITNAVEQRRAEQQLAEQRAFTDQALDTLEDVFYVIDVDGTLRRWNARVVEVTGYDDADLAGRPAVEFVAEADRERVLEAIQETLERGRTKVEASLRTDDGRTVPYEFTGARLTDTDGEVTGIVGIGRSIAERERREAGLRGLQEATEQFMRATDRETVAEIAVRTARAALDQEINGVWFYDENTEVLEPAAISEEGRELLGPPPVYDGPGSLSWQAFRDGEMRVYDDVTEEPGRLNEEPVIRSEIILPLGEYGVMNFGATEPAEFTETDTTLARVFGNTVEAALARAERERELRNQRRRTERQNERLEEFAGVVSHDLRSPLNVAELRLELARDEVTSDHLAEVAAAHERMSALIDDLLTLARQGERVRETEWVSLATVVTDCWRTAETGAATLVCETDRRVRADPSRLRQLLENLFRNAVEHGSTSPGSRAHQDAVGQTSDEPSVADAPEDAAEHGSASPDSEPAVTVTVGDLPDGFYVADDGPGIPDDEREAVFEYGHSTTEDGTGFGLAIVEEIAEAHGWRVEIADDADGARFDVTGVTVAEE